MKIFFWLAGMMGVVVQTAFASGLVFGPFGDVLVRGQEKDPAVVLVLLSDVEGWGAAEEDMAHVAGEAGALVLGVDTARYLRQIADKGYEPNVSHELESMSKYAQKTLGLARLSTPALAGHGAGASIVYASQAQAPAGTFLGGFSLGFRPGLPFAHPFGIGRGLTWTRHAGEIRFDPFTKAALPWTVVQAEHDPVFSASALSTFAQGMTSVRTQTLAGARDYADTSAWSEPLAAFLASLTRPRDAVRPQDVSGLPLIEVPVEGANGDTLAVFVSGDGGWAGIDKDIAAILAKNGIGVVGLDSLRYFWTRRTPEEGGEDLARIIDHYRSEWGAKRVVLIGFSLGADALPPMINALPAETRAMVRQITLLAPSRNVELEFHVSDWLSDDDATEDIPLLPEVKRLAPTPLLCVRGADEETSLCPDLPPGLATIVALPGSHHFNGDFARVAEVILTHLRKAAP